LYVLYLSRKRRDIFTKLRRCWHKYLLFYPILTKLKFNRHILIKILNVKFRENPSSRSRNVLRGQTDRQDEVIFAFHNCSANMVTFNATCSKTNFVKVSQLIQKVKTYTDSMVTSFVPGRGVGCSRGALNTYSGKLVSTKRFWRWGICQTTNNSLKVDTTKLKLTAKPITNNRHIYIYIYIYI